MKAQTEQKIREYLENFRIKFTGEEKPGSVSTLAELVMDDDSSDPVSEEILTEICNIIEKEEKEDLNVTGVSLEQNFEALQTACKLKDEDLIWQIAKRRQILLNNSIEKDEIQQIEVIKQMIAKFSDEKFGYERPFTAPLHHIKKEVDEAIESGEIEEFVDIMLLLLDAYRKRFPDFRVQTLLICCEEKIIRTLPNREWGKADENGVIEHIRK